MAKALATQSRPPRAVEPELEFLTELRTASGAWIEDRLAFDSARESNDLPAIFALAERIAAPLPDRIARREAEICRALCEPAGSADALRIVTRAIGALSSGNEDPDLALEAIMEETEAGGYSAADLLLAKHWLHTPSNHDPERPALPAFRFKPSPAEWIELCEAARRLRVRKLAELDSREEQGAKAAEILAQRSQIEERWRANEIAATDRRRTAEAERARKQTERVEADERKRSVLAQLGADLRERLESGDLERWQHDVLQRYLETHADEDWSEFRLVKRMIGLAQSEQPANGRPRMPSLVEMRAQAARAPAPAAED